MNSAIPTYDLADLRAHLIAWPGLSAIGVRFYNQQPPKPVIKPWANMRQISRVDPARTHDGPSGLFRTRWEIVVWSEDPDITMALGNELGQAMQNIPWTGDVTEGANLERQDPEKGPFGRLRDFIVLHN